MYLKIKNIRLLHERRYIHFKGMGYRAFTWAVIALILSLVFAGGYKLEQRLKGHYQRQEETQLQAAAWKSYTQGDYRAASIIADRTLALNSNNVLACRLMAQLADETHSPLTLEWLQRLAQIEPTLENKLFLASTALNYQNPPFSLTVQILSELNPLAPESAGYQVVAAKLALKNNDIPEAKSRIEKAVALEPSNNLFRLSLASMQASLTNGTYNSLGLIDKKGADQNIGQLVLREMVAERLFYHDYSAAGRYSDELTAHLNASLDDQLQNLDILLELKSKTINPRLKSAQNRAISNPVAVAKVAAWMRDHGYLAESLDWLTDLPIESLVQTPVQIALAQGYLQSGNWFALRKLTTQRNWGEFEYLRFALQFRAYTKLGAPGLASSSWTSAMIEANTHRELMMQLLELAKTGRRSRRRKKFSCKWFKSYPMNLGFHKNMNVCVLIVAIPWDCASFTPYCRPDSPMKSSTRTISWRLRCCWRLICAKPTGWRRRTMPAPPAIPPWFPPTPLRCICRVGTSRESRC